MPATVELKRDQILPRSAIRYRPLSPTLNAETGNRPSLRASRTRSQREPHPTSTPPSVSTATPRLTVHWLIPMVAAMVATILLIWLLQTVWIWGQTISNDIQYGRPRTVQMDAFVGHETGKTPSHFLATNLHGKVYIIELPGGDASKARIYSGPHLSGAGADLVPVTLEFVKRPGSSVSDMIVHCGEIEVTYHNEKGTFVPLTH